jgi:GNAT superfamily N-acetyltransferase
VQDLLVYPEYQRHGIGTSLLKRIMEDYRGVYQLHLLTENTEKTIAFYKSLGFIMDTDIDCRAFSKYCDD